MSKSSEIDLAATAKKLGEAAAKHHEKMVLYAFENSPNPPTSTVPACTYSRVAEPFPSGEDASWNEDIESLADLESRTIPIRFSERDGQWHEILPREYSRESERYWRDRSQRERIYELESRLGELQKRIKTMEDKKETTIRKCDYKKPVRKIDF